MRFFLVLSTLIGIWYSYLAWGFEAYGLWLALLCLPFALILWIPLVYWRRYDREPVPDSTPLIRLMVWLGYTSVAAMSFLFFFSVLRDLGGLVRWTFMLPWLPPFYGENANLVVLGLAGVSLAIGFASARWSVRVERVNVPIRDLPPEWDGVTIAQLSDLHIGATIGRSFVDRLVKRINALDPDLVALTGDFVDGMVPELRSDFARLGHLKSRHGVFYVTGNHEYYWDAPGWIEEARNTGMHVLLNSHVVLKRGEAALVVAGTTDMKADVARAVEGAPAGAPRILLAHKPTVATRAQGHAIDLQLSGHTHGGQFLPWIWVVGAIYQHARGLYPLDGGRWIYVNRGTGYWGPPVRLGSPAEITLLKLVRSPAPTA